MTKLYRKTKLAASIIFILTIPLFIYLGIWQLDRAQYKKELFNKITNQTNFAAMPVNNFIHSDYKQYRFTKVQITGSAINSKNILLDNQTKNKQTGYRIITPVRLNDQENTIILLDRGFIAGTNSRQELPIIPALTNPVILGGIINTPATGMLLREENYADKPQWPLLVQSIDFSQLKKAFGTTLCNFIVQLDDIDVINQHPLDTYMREIHKHKSYAYQWFTFAILGLFYYLYYFYKEAAFFIKNN
jgi:surfeit locus 1 family protein